MSKDLSHILTDLKCHFQALNINSTKILHIKMRPEEANKNQEVPVFSEIHIIWGKVRLHFLTKNKGNNTGIKIN